jgi:hypothetical protein
MYKSFGLLLAAIALATIVLSFSAPTAHAQRPLPPNNPARGIVYDGLDPDQTGECQGNFKITSHSRG